MRETIIRPASDSAESTADRTASLAAADAHSQADATSEPVPCNAAASAESSNINLSAVVPCFDTHARHTRIRIFLHSFKGAVLYVLTPDRARCCSLTPLPLPGTPG